MFRQSLSPVRPLWLKRLGLGCVLAAGVVLASGLPIDPPVPAPVDSAVSEVDNGETAAQLAAESADSDAEMALVGTGKSSCPLTWFHSTYGDNTQVYVSTPGDVDLWTSYSIPAIGNQSLWQNTDDLSAPLNRLWPFALDGYCPFDPTTVECATLRFDVYYDENRGNYNNDTIGFYDSAGNGLAGYAYAPDLQRRLHALSQSHDQWVAVCMDLVSGRVYASEIDAFGVPIRCYDQIGTLSTATRQAILNAASGGALYGIFQDDLQIGFVSLSSTATKATLQQVICPTSVNIIRGGYKGGSVSDLCGSDDHYYEVESYNQTWTHRVVEWDAVFNVADPNNANVCELVIEAEGKRTNKPDVVRISLKDRTTGHFILMGSIPFGERNDLSGTLTESRTSQFIDANGQVTARVFTERYYPQNFTLKTDVLRIWARYSQ